MIDPQSIDLAALPWLPLSERSELPCQPAIYFAIDPDGAVQYIGVSKDLRRRWLQHHRYDQLQQTGKVKIAYLFVDDITLLRPIEAALIAWFQPPLNVIGVSTRESRTKEKLKRKTYDSQVERKSKGNPNPVQTPEFKRRQFKAVGEVPEGVKLGKTAIAAKVPEDVEKLILALPKAERISWIRRVLSEAARKELV